MRVHVVDPPAYTPPYDHALCAALARAGAEVTLVTAPFAHGAVPAPEGYAVDARFYRRVPARARRAGRLARHVPDMLRYRAHGADVVHFQWLAVQPLDWALLPPRRPRLLTAHDVLPREAGALRRRAQAALYARMDAVVAHSEHGARRLRDEAGVPAERIRVIPHGAFTHLAQVEPGPLPPELPDPGDRKVVLFFGLVRPYKGVDVLLEAGVDAEVWIVGMPRMEIGPLRARGGHWVPRFVTDAELAAVFRRADLVVLPYREIEQSGVLFTALAFGTPVVASAVGGFAEMGDVIDLVAPGDPAALREGIHRALAAPRPREPDLGRYGWDAIARETLALYEALLARQT